MKYILPILIITLGITGFFFFGGVGKSERVEVLEIVEAVQVPQEKIQTHIVAEDDTFATILEGYDIGYGDMLTILDSASSTYDFTRVRIGQPLRFVTTLDGTFKRLEYERGTEDIVVVRKIDDVYISEIVDIE
jgi:hypothetical protein